MTTVDLLTHFGTLTRDAAERWVSAALAEAAALRAFDRFLCPLAEDPAAAERAGRLRAAWERWAAGAEDLVGQVRRTPALGGQHVHGLFDLNIEIGFARGLADMGVNELRRRAADVRAGRGQRYDSVGDLRRELGLSPQS